MARRGRPLVLRWREEETEEAVWAAYRAEPRVDVRPRVHAVWLLRSGDRTLDEVAAVVGVQDRSVQSWVAW
jgi:hypothetical protein